MELKQFIEYISWLVLIVNLYSYYLIGNRNKFGFVFGILGCILGISVFLMTSNVPLTLMYICFLILNIKGYLQWK
jgi:hypothetical protein